MSAWCSSIQTSLQDESTWRAHIYIPSSFASLMNFSVTSLPRQCSNAQTFEKTQYVDITDLLSNQYKSMDAVLKSIASLYKYPPNGIFHFEGFDGLESKDSLIQFIKDSAFRHGTYLSVYNTHISKNSSVTLACVHFGVPDKSVLGNKQFVPNMVQAANTIIRVPHSGSSRKHSSRNSKYKRSHLNHNDVDSNMKINRTNTNKCGCKFQLSIFYESTSRRWFLKQRQRRNYDVTFSHHSNHIWIDPMHLCTTRKSLSENAILAIKTLIEGGHPIPSIMSYVRTTCKVNIAYSTVYNMRNNAIDELLKACYDNPSGSSVTKLIQIFKVTKNVSYVYTTHNYNSGFVTFRKNRNQSIQQAVEHINKLEATTPFSNRSIKNWRESLRLKDSNDILVCFAWAHDDEIKAAEMYPEYIAADVTFGVNRERRELFLAVGVDGRNRVFTAFRSFIPSKQEQAYTWILNEAMPSLLSNDVLKYNRCISTDQEKSLMDGINTAMNSNKPAFKYTSFRLDCYHFFTKVWAEKVANKCRDNAIAKACLPIMKEWIMTWFKRLETVEEFEVSRSNFNQYFEGKMNDIGVAAVEGITKLVHNIVSKQKKLLHCHFKDVCTFDFIGDSIVEAANHQLKAGSMGISNSMDIATSGYSQIKSTISKSLKETISSAKKLNSKMTWTKTSSAAYLTEYAEGLACNTFDRRHLYYKKYVGNKTWLVCSSQIFEASYQSLFDKNNDSHTQFFRLRKVTVDGNNFMNCSCMYHVRWMMPCVHMCTVIEDLKYYEISMFHLRWWKHYRYLYKNISSQQDMNIASKNDMFESLMYVRQNHFDQNTGKYKGIPIDGTLFLQERLNTIINSTIDIDEKYLIMKAIDNMNNQCVPLQNGSLKYKLFYCPHICETLDIKTDVPSSEEGSCDDNVLYDFDVVSNMGAGSQVLSQHSNYRIDLSQQSIKSCNGRLSNGLTNLNTDDVEKGDSSMYTRLIPEFNSLVSNVKSEQHFDIVVSKLEKLRFDLIKDGMKGRLLESNELTFLGEENGSRRPEKRFKSSFEK